jgi:hypothetical protein
MAETENKTLASTKPWIQTPVSQKKKKGRNK